MKLVPRTVTQTFGRNILQFKKQSPQIFFVAGILGTVASTVLACRATLKLSDTLDEINGSIKELNENKTALETGTQHENYSIDDYKKDATFVYMNAGFSIVKLYAPAVIIGAASITALTGSHVQLSRRNASLMAAYAVIEKAYDDYRGRVREMIGEERELDVYRGIKTEIIEGEIEPVKVRDTNGLSPYARVFDEYSRAWEKDPELNQIFLRCQQNYANHKLQSRGHMFLNEIYESLGLDHTREGAVVGWIIGKGGDDYIDFGIFDRESSRFTSGFEPSVWLDFNVDGVIWDKI